MPDTAFPPPAPIGRDDKEQPAVVRQQDLGVDNRPITAQDLEMGQEIILGQEASPTHEN